MTNKQLEPFVVNVSEADLTDLRRRLKDTRWASDPGNENQYYGISTSYLRDLVDYWIDGFDWRAAERRINEFTQYRVEVDGVPVHFIREPGKGPAPIPLILSHGWPWTFWDYSKVIRPLADPASYGGDPADAFDVIVPSLAGFGFSTPTAGDMNFWKIADRWNTLMTDILGYRKYAAGGSDYGALVTSTLGHKYAQNLYGIHLGHDLPLNMFNGDAYWSLGAMPEGVSGELKDELVTFYETYASHVAVHMLDAQTLTHGLNDSPAGMLAWLLQRWRKWSDKNGVFEEAYPRDHILTNATIYWVTRSIGSSIRSYRNAVRYPWQPSHDRTPAIEAPAGFTFLSGDVYPPGTTVDTRVTAFENGPTRQWFNPVYAKAHPRGGHFVPWENPEAVIEDVRATFRGLR
ncbi:epoxide hydrolase family protein [Micromonospora mirobrigensis]|uniref:Pimeloyl-ACP methyl ester carboxylesterase n=1 Tax=Micromonospora mirobrigensis TaxID=262898 RepID=A0A1C4V1S0_9ACTN|nr:epoxide hydrolase family protein [Micromonospora mirobrigensis]SCE77771.1 Pimeloyl-ACP methyl ester carboxylesterase [Micromonospora mirobrigensis]